MLLKEVYEDGTEQFISVIDGHIRPYDQAEIDRMDDFLKRSAISIRPLPKVWDGGSVDKSVPKKGMITIGDIVDEEWS